MNNIKKIGTLLVVLAFVASALAVVTPVGADGSRVVDVYFADATTVSNAAPTIGDNITLTAKLQTLDENATAFDVTFTAVNGSNEIPVSVINVGTNVTNATPFDVVGFWDSTTVIPDPALIYSIKVSFAVAGDTNTSNDTKTDALGIDWKAPELGVDSMTGAATGLTDVDYTLTVTIKNFGDAPFEGVQAINVYKDGAGTAKGSGELNTTGAPLAADATETVDVVVPAANLVAGEMNFTAGLNGHDDFFIATFADPISNAYADAISFLPTGVKGTQVVNITATMMNNGTAEFNDTIDFQADGSSIGTVDAVVPVGTAGVAVSFEWTTPTSLVSVDYLIEVVADETINDTLTVLPTPHTDLGVAGIAFAPVALVALDDVGMTQDVTVTVTVTNTLGDLDAVDEVVTLNADGVEVGTDTVNITAGGTADVVFTYPAKTMEDASEVNITATIGAVTDYKLLTVPGDIDLAEFEITAVVAPVKQERTLSIDITATVKNIGDALAEEVTVTFFAGTTEIGTMDLVNVTAGGENTTAALTWTIPSTFALGDTIINATVGDIFLTMNFTVEEFRKPIVTIEFEKNTKDKVKSYSAEAADGAKKTIKVKVVLENTGTADAKNVVIILKDKKGKELGNATVATIAAGGEATQEIAIKVKAGTSTKMTAEATYDGIHDDSYPATATAETAGLDVAVVPGFEAVVFVAAIGIAVVVLSRRRK